MIQPTDNCWDFGH